jgi:predicted MFS family arabinose efflux permease
VTNSAIASIKPTLADNPDPHEISSWMTTLFATASGLLAANVYYSQPVAELIAGSLGLSSSATGLIVAFTQAGFGIGLFLIVPLGDLMENRRLVLTLICVTAVALLTTATSAAPLPYLTAALLVGLGSVAVQVLIPFAAHMAPERVLGRIVGNVMSGLMIGIMLARPASSFVTQLVSWHAVFYVSSGSMFALALALALALPKREPAVTISYFALLKSMGRLALTTPILQRRALYQACLFEAFSCFGRPCRSCSRGLRSTRHRVGWRSSRWLAGPAQSRRRSLGAPRRGWTEPATAFAILCVAVAILITRFAAAGSSLGIPLLIAAAILLDSGMTATLTPRQRAIFVLGAEYRSRLNGLYMSAFFAGGAVGSTLGGLAYALGGWSLASWIGFALPMLAFAFFLMDRIRAHAWPHDANV